MATTPSQALELLLGPAGDEHVTFRPDLLARQDRLEEFPAGACRTLDAFGLPGHYVPAAFGGELTDHLELMQLLRTVARRDLTVAVAHGKTFLGAAAVWVAAGDPRPGPEERARRTRQAGRLAVRIGRGEPVSWGLTERDHGSDLLAGELSATPVPGGWRLDGEKWLINNASRGALICLLARTGTDGGPRGFSLFLVDQEQLRPGSRQHLPKVRTHGIRGADISGIVLDGARVPADALVGSVGQGAELVLKALQLTRTACVSLSLGAADHAWQLALEHVREQVRYGHRLADLPRVRRVLGEVAGLLVLAEASAIVAGRSIAGLTGELAVVAAVVKALVPTLVQQALEQLAELLGVRGFLTGHPQHGAFARLQRDHQVVGIFDGSTAVNRNALIDQFPLLAAAYRRHLTDAEGLRIVASGEASALALDPGRLALVSARGCSLVQSLPGLPEQIENARAGGRDVPAGLPEAVETIVRAAGLLHAELGRPQRSAATVPAAAFTLAEQYELCFAAAACLHLWLAGERLDGGRTSGDDWLPAALEVVTRRLGLPSGPATGEVYDRLAAGLLDGAWPRLVSAGRREHAASPA